ncbi:MAG TPA: hypothetical protein VKH36_11590 [Acidimicrobiia bacterium]|nr:hypothetical protein [Acidimicrobiia bacterium]
MKVLANGRGERGYVAGELAIGVGLLVFPVALLVLTLPTWSERQTTARSVAREVARVVAIAGVCDRQRALDTGADMARNLGLPPADLDIRLDCLPGARLSRSDRVRASVTVAVPAVDFPGIGGVGAWSWTAHHSEPIDQYRSFE